MIKPHKNHDNQSNPLIKKLNRYKLLSVILLLSTIAFAAYSFTSIRKEQKERNYPYLDKHAPFFKEINAIISPLRYSGLPHLNQSDTFISLNFQNKTWRLHNIHMYDKNGEIYLAEGKYGICGDLSVYTYQKLKKILNKNYTIEFINASESSFFSAPLGSHYLLRIIDRTKLPNVTAYLLDPSFKRYARADMFDEYYFYKKYDVLPFLKKGSTDAVFEVKKTTPLLIKKNFLIQLAVDDVNGKFDKDNFMVALYLTKRYKVSGKYIYTIARKNGEIIQTENTETINSLMTKKDYKKLKDRVKHIFNNIRFENTL